MSPAATEEAKKEKTPIATFKEDVKNKPVDESGVTTYLSREKGSALHPEESEFDAYMRISNRVYGQMLPHKQKYDLEAKEVQDAFEGLMNGTTMFPLVFMFVDAKLSTIMAHRPRAVFDLQSERAKLQFIEAMYNHYTTDVNDGIDEEVINYVWHLFNELYGWSVKRVWWEVDMQIDHEPIVEEDDDGNIVYAEDGFAKIKYERRQFVKGKVKQRVYMPDMVAVTPNKMFFNECFDVVFIEDMDFDEWSQQYLNNPNYENTEKVRPGMYYTFNPATVAAEDDTTGQLVLYDTSIGLDKDRVRVEEYYSTARDEYYVKFNGHKARHIPNPTPPVNGKKVLPIAGLQNRPRPGTCYWKPEPKLVEAIVVAWQKLLSSKTRRAELAGSPVVLTDMPSGLAPKSFKVVPGAHWRGMKGRAEILNLAGVDTGEIKEVMEEMKQLAKVTTGVDFERFVADPDPTLGQQLAREGASKLRTEKDAALQEKLGYVRSAELMVSHLLFYIPIPEIADAADLSEEEMAELSEFDKIDENTYYKYPRIPLEEKMFIEQWTPEKDENGQETGDGKLELIPYLGVASQAGVKTKAKNYFLARQQYLRTKMPVKVRVTSDRKRATNRNIRREDALFIMNQAFALAPKNQFEIDKQLALQKEPPKPEYYINREEAVKNVLDMLGEDVQRFTSSEDKKTSGKASQLLAESLQGKVLKLGENLDNLPAPNPAITASVQRKQPAIPLEQDAAETLPIPEDTIGQEA